MKFHIREATGSAALPVYLYANTGSSTWTESGVTWNNSGLTLGDLYATASPASNTDTVYDITELVKDWKNGSQTAAKGFVMVSSNETSKDKAFYAAEHSSTSYRPYVVMNYYLNSDTIELQEGNSHILSTSGIIGTITWKSSNTTIATVNSSGTVTAVKAGTTTVTASVSGSVQKTFNIYVYIRDGVYYIKNNNSGYHLGTENSNVASGTDVQQVASKSSDPYRLSQLWKVKYLSSGYYSIRPMHKLDTALYATGTSVEIRTANSVDSLSYITTNYRWTISYQADGYVFRNGSSATMALVPSGYSTSANTDVILSTYSSTLVSYRWTLVQPTASVNTRIQLYDSQASSFPSSITRSIAPGETLTLNQLGVSASFVSEEFNTQNIKWYSNDSTVAYVDEETGTVIGVKPGGTTTITAEQKLGSTTYTSSTYCTFRINISSDPIDGYTVLPARILYDSTCPYSEEELKEFYAQATYDFLTKFHIIFALYDISSTTSFELSTPCFARTNGDLCTEECAPLTDCGNDHHRSAHRILQLERTSVHYTCRVVGYMLCGYDEDGHGAVAGLANRNGKNTVVTTYGTGLPGLIQHELAHNMGTSDWQCTEGQDCVMSGKGLGNWCDKCIAIINAKF